MAGRNNHPITIPGLGGFSSRNAACESLGITYSCLNSRISTSYYGPEATAMREKRENGIPTKFRHYTVGEFATFSTLTNASMFLKISTTLLKRKIKDGEYGGGIKAEKKQTSQVINSMWKPNLRSIA